MEVSAATQQGCRLLHHKRRWFDVPFAVMGLSFIMMAAMEYIFPEGTYYSRQSIKILCAGQIAWAIVITIFNRAYLIFSRYVSISFTLLLVWICCSGVVRTQDMSATMYLWGMYLYWYSLFVFFYVRCQIVPERLQAFLVLATISLFVWLPALKGSTAVIMKVRYNEPVSHLLQNYIGYYIVAMFPYALLLKRKALKIILIILITFGATYSLKRGAVLALFLMGFAVSWIYFFITKSLKKKIRICLALVSVWVIAILIGGWFVVDNWQTVENRIETTTNRPKIFGFAFREIEDAKFYELIVGHGDQQIENAINGLTHNDWLFLIYNYGFIGAFLMLNVYLCVLWIAWKMWRDKSTLLMPLVSALILMACIQIYSVGLYLKTFGLITGSIGLAVGSYYSRNKTLNLNIRQINRFV